MCVVPCSFSTIQNYERGVLIRLGKRTHKAALAGGMHFLLPCGVDQLMRIDIREQILDLRNQNVVTKEGLSLMIDACVYFKVIDASKALLTVTNLRQSIMYLAQTKLREILSAHTFEQIQTQRGSLAVMLKKILDDVTEHWGVDVTRVEITDIVLPESMKRAMGQEAEAARSAKAKIIEAEGERQAASTLKDAADILATGPGAMQLRLLQTLRDISSEKTSTIIIPFPTELMSLMGNQALIRK